MNSHEHLEEAISHLKAVENSLCIIIRGAKPNIEPLPYDLQSVQIALKHLEQVEEEMDGKKDAMIEWLAQVCEELAVELCEYPKYQCPKLKSDWIREAEKAMQGADRK